MERKEPTFSSAIPSADLHTTDKRGTPTGSKGPADKKIAPQKTVKPPVNKSGASSLPALLLGALAVAGVVALGYLTYQDNQRLSAALVEADGRIKELEARLALSDDESTQSVSAIHDKLEWADSEIRKLWGVSYDRNRKAIADNEQQIQSLEKTLKSVKGQADKAVVSTSSHDSQIKQLGLQVGTAAEQASQALTSATAAQKQTREITDSVNRQGTVQADLSKRVKVNEEAIRAIDADRVRVNRDILEIKTRLGGG